jgi:hypothetical protein
VKSRPARILRSLRAHSQVVRAIQLGAGWLRLGLYEILDATPIAHATLHRAESEVPPRPDVTFALLRRIQSFCGLRSIRLIVLLIPSHPDVRPGSESSAQAREDRAAYETAVRFCRDLRLDAVEMRPRLAEMERRGAGGFHQLDIHLNAEGHRVAAELLLSRLEAR